jgi:hypothetical protein
VRVFLSHRTESEGALAGRLSGDLEAAGIATWVAPRDIDSGVTWPQAIEAGLQACTHVAVLVSGAAMESRAVRQELQIAEMLQLDGQIALVPVLVERVVLPPWLRVLQAVDLTGAYGDGLAALVRSLRERGPAGAASQERSGVIMHRVRRGERIDLLAARYLGSAADWRLIADDNPGLDTSRLAPGMVVAIRRRRP